MATKTKSGGGFGEFIKTVVYALLLAGIIRSLIFQPFWIPSSSMKPTLLIGDFLFVNKFAYGYSYASCPAFGRFNLCSSFEDKKGRLLGGMPERGDVVVFRHPTLGVDYIKRLIGLPGDRLRIENGQIILNGTPVQRVPDGMFSEIYEEQGPERGKPYCVNSPVGLGGDCLKEQFSETLPNGVEHKTLNITDAIKDNTEEFIVPEDHFFFMGDNRDNSLDSRWPLAARGVGYVPLEDIVGRADRIMFSSAGKSLFFFWTWRSDRFFKAVN